MSYSIDISQKYLVNIVIIGHGTTIDLSLNDYKKKLLENTTLYSVAPYTCDYTKFIYSIKQITKDINSVFSTDFTEEENIDKIQLYKKNFMKDKDPITSMYNIYPSVNYDKMFYFEKPTYFNYFNRTISSIFLSNVHVKIGNKYVVDKNLSNKYDLLFDMETLANLLDNNNNLYSTIIKEKSDYNKENYFQLTKEERRDFINHFNFSMKDGFIDNIKMSSLIKYIKLLFGEDTHINLYDFTCNGLASFVDSPTTYRGGRKSKKSIIRRKRSTYKIYKSILS
jgi:hypothetical protein